MTDRTGWVGRYFEDFHVGDRYRHRAGRTISEADNTWFTLLTSNSHPIHVDAAYAARTEFGRPLVVSTLTLAVVTGLSVPDVSQNAVANLGWDDVRLTAPVFAGDTLYAESVVESVRPSRSRPGQGIVTVRTRGLNQRGDEVISFRRTVLVYGRAAAPEAGPPEPAGEPGPAGRPEPIGKPGPAGRPVSARPPVAPG